MTLSFANISWRCFNNHFCWMFIARILLKNGSNFPKTGKQNTKKAPEITLKIIKIDFTSRFYKKKNHLFLQPLAPRRSHKQQYSPGNVDYKFQITILQTLVTSKSSSTSWSDLGHEIIASARLTVAGGHSFASCKGHLRDPTMTTGKMMGR